MSLSELVAVAAERSNRVSSNQEHNNEVLTVLHTQYLQHLTYSGFQFYRLLYNDEVSIRQGGCGTGYTTVIDSTLAGRCWADPDNPDRFSCWLSDIKGLAQDGRLSYEALVRLVKYQVACGNWRLKAE